MEFLFYIIVLENFTLISYYIVIFQHTCNDDYFTGQEWVNNSHKHIS